MAARLAGLLPRLNERDRRLALATEARSWGYGGVTAVHQATGASRSTIRRGLGELDNDTGEGPNRRVRAPGGGRKRAEVADPELRSALDSLIEPATRGDPESPLRWTTKSTRHLAGKLTAMGHAISHSVVANLLGSAGFSLQGTRKTLEGAQHPDRDAQFRYINSTAGKFLAAGEPVISVDTKKRAGQTVHPGRAGVAAHRRARGGVHLRLPRSGRGQGHPVRGLRHRRRQRMGLSRCRPRHLGLRGRHHRAVVAADGTVQVPERNAATHPRRRRRIERTPPLAVETRTRPPGHNHRTRHHRLPLPTRHQQMNKIEHRLFSRITGNWRGRPLETYQTVVSLIANTTTVTGLTVRAELDLNLYPTKIKLTDQQKKSIPITRHDFHGNWNYTIRRPNE